MSVLVESHREVRHRKYHFGSMLRIVLAVWSMFSVVTSPVCRGLLNFALLGLDLRIFSNYARDGWDAIHSKVADLEKAGAVKRTYRVHPLERHPRLCDHHRRRPTIERLS